MIFKQNLIQNKFDSIKTCLTWSKTGGEILCVLVSAELL